MQNLLQNNRCQARQQRLAQKNQASAGLHSSGMPSPSSSSVYGLTLNPIPNAVGGQNSNMQKNMSGFSQNSMGQGFLSDIFADQPWLMQGRQQLFPQQKQQHLYQQGNLQHSLMQQNMFPPTQLQSGMQTSSIMQSTPFPGLQQDHQSCLQQSMLQQQQPQQYVSAGIHQQQIPMNQQYSMMPQQPPQTQQQQQQQPQQSATANGGFHRQQMAMHQRQKQQEAPDIMGKRTNAANIQQKQLIGQQNSINADRQQQRLLGLPKNLNLQRQQPQQSATANGGIHRQQTPKHQRQLQQQQEAPDIIGQRTTNAANILQKQLISQQNTINDDRQQQRLLGLTKNLNLQRQQEKLMAQQTNLSNIQQQQLSPQNNISGLQPQQQKLIGTHGQLDLKLQPNQLKQNMKKRLQPSSFLLQSQNLIHQQEQLHQSQRTVPQTSSNSTAETGHVNESDLQEEIYQKIKTLKDAHLLEFNEMYQKVSANLQKHVSVPQQQQKSELLEKLKIFKNCLEDIINFLSLPKADVLRYKDTLGKNEEHINKIIKYWKPSKSNITEQPCERLMKAVESMSLRALAASVFDIGSVVRLNDRIAAPTPGNGSRGAVGEDLVITDQYGTKKLRRYISAMPINSETSEFESGVKRPRIEAKHALLEEIREINQRLIDTVVDVSDEYVDPEGEGTIVKCCFSAVALSSNLKSQYMSAQMSPIQPLRLLVPENYPNCSPIILDKLPVEVSKEYEVDLSVKAKSKLSKSLRSLSQPMSLGEIVRTWNVCARAVIVEHAQQSGGGSFSSKYGTWENYLSAA